MAEPERLCGAPHFAQAKALKLRTDNNFLDGTINFSSGLSYTFDPNNRAVSGAFDFIGFAQHEITEVMGRTRLKSFYDPEDLFGYSSPGVLDLSSDHAGIYFSIDGGVTNLQVYNDGSNGGDPKDFADGVPDPFDAFISPGVKYPLSNVGLQSMDVIGYDRVVPEPSSIALAGVVGLALLRRRRRCE